MFPHIFYIFYELNRNNLTIKKDDIHSTLSTEELNVTHILNCTFIPKLKYRYVDQ